MLLKIEGEQREREQRVAGTVEVPLPWRAPALGRSPIVTEAMSLSRVKDVATDKGQVLQDSDASGCGSGSSAMGSAARRLSQRVSA